MQANRRAEIAKYYDNFLPRLLADHNGQNARIGNVKSKIADVLRLPVFQAEVRGEKAKILDLGCGTGITSQFMASLGADVTAVDISPENIKAAMKLSKHKNVRYILGDITSLDLRGRKFDGIVMVDCFEHIPMTDAGDVMNSLRRHSHKNTWLYLNIPDERFQNMAKAGIPDRLQMIDETWSIGHIQSVFRQANFEMTKVEVYGIDVGCQYASIVFSPKADIDRGYRRFIDGIGK